MGRRLGITLLVLLVLLVGLGVIADRVAVAAAERLAVAKVEDSLDVSGTPQIDVHGFPFLTQALNGTLDKVTAHADAITLDGTPLSDVDVTANGVSTRAPYAVQRAVVTGTLSTAALEQLVTEHTGVAVTLRPEGEQLIAMGNALGLPWSAHLVPRAEGGEIHVEVASVRLGGMEVSAGSLPGGLGSMLSDLAIPIDGLPQGVAVTDVTVSDAGVRLTATGTDVLVPTGGR